MASIIADSRKLTDQPDWRPRHADLKAIVASAPEWERRG
jgi:UDP-glucose 4-epimerase